MISIKMGPATIPNDPIRANFIPSINKVMSEAPKKKKERKKVAVVNITRAKWTTFIQVGF